MLQMELCVYSQGMRCHNLKLSKGNRGLHTLIPVWYQLDTSFTHAYTKYPLSMMKNGASKWVRSRCGAENDLVICTKVQFLLS